MSMRKFINIINETANKARLGGETGKIINLVLESSLFYKLGANTPAVEHPVRVYHQALYYLEGLLGIKFKFTLTPQKKDDDYMTYMLKPEEIYRIDSKVTQLLNTPEYRNNDELKNRVVDACNIIAEYLEWEYHRIAKKNGWNDKKNDEKIDKYLNDLNIVKNHKSKLETKTKISFGNKKEVYKAILALDDTDNELGITKKAFDEAYDEFKSLRNSKVITIFRFVQLTDRFIKELKPRTNLGGHWSFDFIPDNIDLYDQIEVSVGLWYVIEATVNFSDIDILQSLWFNCVFPHEREVNIKNDIPRVKFEGIRRLSDDSTENLRPDLVGKMFYAKMRENHVSPSSLEVTP